MSADLQFQEQVLSLRAERQKLLAANIANADTPNFKARDMDFSKALAKATGASTATSLPLTPPSRPAGANDAGATSPSGGLLATHVMHRPTIADPNGQTYSTQSPEPLYRVPEQASMDGNTVDMDRERANFADNAVRYEATLRFINGNVRSILSAIRGD